MCCLTALEVECSAGLIMPLLLCNLIGPMQSNSILDFSKQSLMKKTEAILCMISSVNEIGEVGGAPLCELVRLSFIVLCCVMLQLR
jgi:hypothetical protein